MTEQDRSRFSLGRVVATPGAIAALERTNEAMWTYLARHSRLDPGVLDTEDQEANARAVRAGGRIFSAYTLRDGTKLWVITEHDRSATTVLLPEEY